MSTMTLYHATRANFETFDPSKTVDGGLHFGAAEQARMRAGAKARLIEVEITIENPRRSRDLGSQWAKKIRSARNEGHDAIVYLNRYEGLSLARVEEAIQDKVNLDDLTDAQFRKRIPEATDSYIVFDPALVRVIRVHASHAEVTRSAPILPAIEASPVAAMVTPLALTGVSLGVVTHIGTLDVSHKGEQGASHEGDGLSFSNHPQAWTTIAHLGGKPWWTTDLSDRAIVDGHACLHNEAILNGLHEWAQAKNLAHPNVFFKASWTDGETDEVTSVWVSTRKRAQAELADQDEPLPVEKIHGWAPTPALLQRMMQPVKDACVPHPLLDQLLLTAYAQDHGWEGVWWNDTLAPARHSAPRGVIFADTAAQLDWTPANPAMPFSARRTRRSP
jgi:hypothetical protein